MPVVKGIFESKLGFTPFPGNKLADEGLDQATIELPPAYIELLWPYREPAADARPIARTVRKSVESGGGLFSYNIDVSPVEQAVDAMRKVGLRVMVKPSRATDTVDGKEVPACRFAVIDPQDMAAQLVGVQAEMAWDSSNIETIRSIPTHSRDCRRVRKEKCPILAALAERFTRILLVDCALYGLWFRA